MRRRLLIVACVAVWPCPAVAHAQTMLTLQDVLTRARDASPEVVQARLAIEEARATLAGASIRAQTNPDVEAALGTRDSGTGRSAETTLGVWQTFEPPGRRAARIAAATSAVAASRAEAERTARVVVASAAAAYFRALHAAERIRLLAAAEELAATVHRTAERRFTAGDIAVLDVNVARAALARARADRAAAEAGREDALGALKQVLGLAGEIAVQGTLALPGDPELEPSLAAAGRRPELRVLQAGLDEARAEQRLAASWQRPDYGLGVQYAQEEGDRIVVGGLRVTLPIFSRGQGPAGASAARAARLGAALEAARQRVDLEVRTAFAAYRHRLAALRVLDLEAAPVLDENDALTTRSFEVGQIGLPVLLLLRRESLETRLQHLDARLEAALARVTLDASVGILP
jgi:cobalt-zinc-cadmium efflux system outer membrane protein